MADLVVNLYEHDFNNMKVELKNKNIKIKRVLSPDSDSVVEFVSTNFTKRWASEVKSALYNANPSCYIAVLDEEIIGFACFNATAKGYFGPTGIHPKYRGLNIGQILLFNTLNAMKSEGYGYSIIGSVSESVIGFYSKHIKLTILNSNIDIYNRMRNR